GLGRQVDPFGALHLAARQHPAILVWCGDAEQYLMVLPMVRGAETCLQAGHGDDRRSWRLDRGDDLRRLRPKAVDEGGAFQRGGGQATAPSHFEWSADR